MDIKFCVDCRHYKEITRSEITGRMHFRYKESVCVRPRKRAFEYNLVSGEKIYTEPKHLVCSQERRPGSGCSDSGAYFKPKESSPL